MATTKITNINQISSIFDNKMVAVIDYVTIQVYYKLRENIIDKAYSETSTTEYFNGRNRTGQFIESFKKEETKIKLRQVIGRIFQDVNVMQVLYASDGNFWNAHADIWGNDVRNGLIDILNGDNTGVWKTGSREGHFLDDTLDWIDKNIDRLVMEGATKAGIPIVKR